MPVSDQGTLLGRYTLIPRTLVFLTQGKHVLLLKGAPHKRLWANRYNGVGGHIERGEDIISAARRELLEETGLDVPRLWLCGVVTVDTGQEVGIGIFILRGEYDDLANQANAKLHPSTEGTLEWVPFGQASSLPLVEDLYTLLPRLLALQPGSPPFSALYTYAEDGRLVIRFTE